MAGRRAPSRNATVFAQTPKVADEKTQRALDVHSQAILDLQARRHLEQFSSTEPGYVPESGGSDVMFLCADGAWKVVAGSGVVDSVTAGSSMVSVAPTTGNVVVDVVPANFTGIPMSGVTFSGTNNVLAKFSGTTLADSTIADTGSLVTVTNAFKVTGAADFDSTVNIDGTLTLSTMTQGSVLFVGASGVVSQDNTNFYWEDTNNRLFIGSNSVFDNTSFPGGGTIGSLHLSRDAADAQILAVAHGAGVAPSFIGVRGRGTRAAPAVVQASDTLVNFTGSGYADAIVNRFASGASMRFVATGTWTTTSFPTRVEFLTCDTSETTASIRSTITSDGKLLVGTTTISDNAVVGGGTNSFIEFERTSNNLLVMASVFSATAGHAGGFVGIRGRGSRSSPGVVSSGDALLYIQAGGYFATTANNFGVGGQIQFFADGNWSGSSKGTRITFTTTPNGSATSGNRMTITSDGAVIIGTATAKTKTPLTSSLEVTRDAASQVAITSFASTPFPEINFWSGRGTAASTTVTQSTDSLGQISFTGSTSATAGFSSALIRAAATENFTAATNFGGKLEFLTTTNASGSGGRAVRLTIDHNGTATFANNVAVTGDFAVNTNKFTVTAASGNTTVAGTLGVASATTTLRNLIVSGVNGTSSIDAQLALSASTVHNEMARLIVSGTCDTTAGAILQYGATIQSNVSRSAGANDVTNFGLLLNAQNGQINRALQTEAGDVILNNTSGITQIKGATTLTSTLSVEGNTTIGNGTSDSHVVNGKLRINTAVGAQNLEIHGETNGLTDGAIQIKSHKNAWGDITGQLLTTAGGSTSADKFTISIDSGSLNFSTGGLADALILAHAGNATFAANVTVSGNATICDAAGDTLKFHGGTGATQQTVTGSRGGSAALADLLTKLATLGLIVDGTTA